MPAKAVATQDYDRDIADVVIYARYSSAHQNDQSIEGQIHHCMDYADRHGFRVVGQYIDRALSGTQAETRPEFQRMIRDGKKGIFQYVLVWKLDRFARNRYDSAIYKAELKKAGVRVLSTTEGIDEGSDSVILEAILEAMAEEYSRQLAQNVRRGIRQNAEKLLSIGGKTPLGYRAEDKRLMVEEREAEIVRFIFKEYTDGKGKAEIAEACNARGWRSKAGKPFTLNSFQAILTNRAYIGDYVFKGTVMAEGAVPAIVDRDIFDRAGKLLARNKRAPGRAKAKEEYRLQGKVFCGYCGSPMVGESGKGRHGKAYHYYACATRKKSHTCRKRNEKKGFLEWYVVEQIVTQILTEEKMAEIAAGVVAEYNKSFDAANIKALEKRIGELDREMDSLVDTLIRTTAQQAAKRINEKIDLLDAQKQELEIELAGLRIAAKITLTEQDVIKWLRQFAHQDISDPEVQQNIIDIFVNAVYIFDDKIAMYFNVKDTNQVSYMEMQADIDGLDVSDLMGNGVPDFDLSEHIIIFYGDGVFGCVLNRNDS